MGKWRIICTFLLSGRPNTKPDLVMGFTFKRGGLFRMRYRAKRCVKILFLECDMDLVSDPYGQVKRGSWRLKGDIISVNYVPMRCLFEYNATPSRAVIVA